MSIFEKSVAQRRAHTQQIAGDFAVKDLPENLLRKRAAKLPEVSELDVVRHYTQLSRQNFCIDTNMYPLGSCTMKYNPRGAERLASLPGFLARHPYASLAHSQGFLSCVYELQQMLAEVTGMHEVSLTPMAGAQGELAGVMMIKAYHTERGDLKRTEMLIPDAAHGTNPASAAMCGYTIREIATDKNGDLKLDDLRAALSEKTAGIMLTNPSTLGVFDRNIEEVARLVHEAGALLYYDGANLNAIVGKVKPAQMGFDVMHINLHKTFATPHGGGGPGAGPVLANSLLSPYLPTPIVGKQQEKFYWLEREQRPQTIGRLSTFMGNAGVLLRAYAYFRMLGREGIGQVAEYAVLNANYLQKNLARMGYSLALPERLATHEFIVTLQKEAKEYGVTAKDVAKRLLDYGIHAPTTYFPLLVPECLLIEPTETENKQTLDYFLQAMAEILADIKNDPQKLITAPHSQKVNRMDEVLAVKKLDVVYSESELT